MVTKKSLHVKRLHACMAADCPKLRRSLTTLTRSSTAAIAASSRWEPSLLPSSTNTISYIVGQTFLSAAIGKNPCPTVEGVPQDRKAALIRSCSLLMLSFSSLIGLTIDRSIIGPFVRSFGARLCLGIRAKEIDQTTQ